MLSNRQMITMTKSKCESPTTSRALPRPFQTIWHTRGGYREPKPSTSSKDLIGAWTRWLTICISQQRRPANEKATSSLRILSKSSGLWCSSKHAARRRLLTEPTWGSTLLLPKAARDTQRTQAETRAASVEVQGRRHLLLSMLSSSSMSWTNCEPCCRRKMLPESS